MQNKHLHPRGGNKCTPHKTQGEEEEEEKEEEEEEGPLS